MLSSGLTRSQTVLRREGRLSAGPPPPYYDPPQTLSGAPSPVWTPDFFNLPTPHEHFEIYPGDDDDDNAPAAAAAYGNEAVVPMSVPPGKTSSDSGQGGVAGLDRWSQRRLQRLNTEQGFREQRQGGSGGLTSPHIGGSSVEHGTVPDHSISQQQHASASSSYPPDQHLAQPPHQPQQQHPAAVSLAYQNTRPAPTVSQLGNTSSTSRSPSFAAAHHHHHPPSSDPASAHAVSSSSPYPAADPHYRPPTSASSSDPRPPLATSRSYGYEDMSSSTSASASSSHYNNNNNNNGGLPAPKAVRSAGNRQSVHNGLSSAGARDGGVPAFNASIVPAAPGYTATPKGDIGRLTPQPSQVGEEMSEEDVNQLIKDHKELRETSPAPSPSPPPAAQPPPPSSPAHPIPSLPAHARFHTRATAFPLHDTNDKTLTRT